MSEAGLVTIILPNRNHAHYLPRALDSVLAQTWTKLEIIVVDDASTDSSLAVIAAYKRRDDRVRALGLKEHHGINRAVNVALGSTNGEFVTIAGADDFVAPNFIERCVVELNRYPEAGLSFSDPTELREPEMHLIHFPLYLSEKSTFFTSTALIALFRRNYFHISANTGLYRTAAFREVGGYRPELHWLSDWFATLVIALRYGACFLPEQLTTVTMRGESYSARNLRNGRAQRPLLKEVLKLLASAAYRDVAPHMQHAGLIPEYHIRALIWLLESAEGRKFVTPHLVLRIVSRYLWSFLRPVTPVQWRRQLRQAQGKWTRAA